jgi:hypothetical protein
MLPICSDGEQPFKFGGFFRLLHGVQVFAFEVLYDLHNPGPMMRAAPLWGQQGFPMRKYDREAVRRSLEYALEVRRRVKEQLKKIGGMEFFDVHFLYFDVETMEEKFISVPEKGGGSLIPDGPLNPGVMHTVASGPSGRLG